MIDWWDEDEQRTRLRPRHAATRRARAAARTTSTASTTTRIVIKNAPFDSLEELRLIRGVGDDFWATFVEARPRRPARAQGHDLRLGRGQREPGARREVLLARLCSFVTDRAAVQRPAAGAAFITLFNTLRAIVPVPLFPRDALPELHDRRQRQERRPGRRARPATRCCNMYLAAIGPARADGLDAG